MAIMSTGNFPQDLRPGIRMWFGNAYKLYATIYDKILEVKEADSRAYEEDVMASNLGLPQVKTQGAPVTYDVGNQLYSVRYPHIQYGLGFSITQEMMDDGIALKNAQIYAESLKLSMLRGREIQSANVYANGFSVSTSTEGGDGVAWFSSSHPSPAGNLTNVPTTPATLAESSVEQAHIDIGNMKDNRGQLIYVRAQKLVVPLNLQFTANRVLQENGWQSNSADRNINAMVEMGMRPEIVVDPYLSSTTNWFIGTDQPGRYFYNRKDITLSDDNEFDTENAKFKGLMRFSVGVSDWRSGYGVNA
jgi:Mu-like prophage major head subunit gpT